MDSQEILRLINLNTNFYVKHQEEFSKSRRNYWNGWAKIIDIINQQNINCSEINILDIGCGNGRFYKYLSQNLNTPMNYLGLDNNDYFLLEAIIKYEKARFQKLDILNDIKKITGQYHLVSIFGLAHHIPASDFRKAWFTHITNIVDEGGLVAISFWDLTQDPRAAKLIKIDNSEDNDYYYGWADSKDFRYVHIYDNKELEDIKQIFYAKKFKLMAEYNDDGKSQNLNRYLIFSL